MGNPDLVINMENLTVGSMASTLLGCSVDEVNKAIIQMKKKQQLGENMLLFSPSACSQ